MQFIVNRLYEYLVGLSFIVHSTIVIVTVIQIVSLGLLIGFCGLRQHLWSW